MKRPQRIALVFLFLLITVYTASADPAQTPTTPVEVLNHTELLFLGNYNIPPVVYLEGATPSGVAVDLVRALAKHLSRPVEIRAMNWSEAQALVARGDADALIQINPTEERLKIYDFSDPLLESQFSIFTRADKLGISDASSLRGLRVGVESGGLPRQVLEKDPQILLTIIPNFTEGFRQLSDGSLDVVVVDYLVGSYTLAENNIQNIKVTGDPIVTSNSSIAVKKGNRELLQEINTALGIIKSDGTYQKIIDDWKPTVGIFETQQQITERFYRISIVVLLVLFLIAVIWTLTIRSELTKRKRAEEQLIESEERFRVLFEQATDAILVYDIDLDRFTDANANAELLFGCDRSDLIRHGPAHFYPPDQAMSLSVSESVQEHNKQVMNGKKLLFERVIRSMKGDIRVCEVRQVRLPSKERRLIRVSYIDITDRKRVEKELLEYRTHLEELVRERTLDLQTAKEQTDNANKKLNLLSNITRHDIGNELQVIFGYLGLARDYEMNPYIKEYIDNAYMSARNIERQIAFTRDYQSIGVHSPVWQNISTVVYQAVQTLDMSLVQVLIELPEIEIYGDPLMGKVFFNLVDNARRYGETITTIRFSGFEGPKGYTIVCEDDGVGISDAYKKKIFTHEFFKHTGFGLNLSREILEITGITITETGKAGKGARFEILVPQGKFRFI